MENARLEGMAVGLFKSGGASVLSGVAAGSARPCEDGFEISALRFIFRGAKDAGAL